MLNAQLGSTGPEEAVPSSGRRDFVAKAVSATVALFAFPVIVKKITETVRANSAINLSNYEDFKTATDRGLLCPGELINLSSCKFTMQTKWVNARNKDGLLSTVLRKTGRLPMPEDARSTTLKLASESMLPDQCFYSVLQIPDSNGQYKTIGFVLYDKELQPEQIGQPLKLSVRVGDLAKLNQEAPGLCAMFMPGSFLFLEPNF